MLDMGRICRISCEISRDLYLGALKLHLTHEAQFPALHFTQRKVPQAPLQRFAVQRK